MKALIAYCLASTPLPARGADATADGRNIRLLYTFEDNNVRAGAARSPPCSWNSATPAREVIARWRG